MEKPRVQLLSPDVIQKIAAGEVVERPASVVKELVENALDAGARRVEVDVRGGGLECIRVSDDGSGMSEADARLAPVRHATSKIRSADDLKKIETLGFRGEALAAVGAVSRLTLLTCLPGSSSGVRVVVEGGKEILAQPAARPPGTTVTVERLFYNTPARLKFLKSRATEVHHAQQVFQAYALAYPEVTWVLLLDGGEVLHLEAGPAFSRMEQVLEAAGKLRPVAASRGRVALEGAVGEVGLHRSGRDGLFFFVNRRFVQEASLNAAVLRAYRSLLPARRYPVGALFWTLPPEWVDVNVHPTKREVKFSKEADLFQLTLDAVQRVLFSTSASIETKAEAPSFPSGEIPPAAQQPPPKGKTRPGAAACVEEAPALSFFREVGAVFTKSALEGGRSREGEGGALLPKDVLLHGFQQFFNTFIAFQSDSVFYLADQHALHERLNYEKLLLQAQKEQVESQGLLVPETVSLSPAALQVLLEARDFLKTLGVDFESFGKDTVLVRALPADVAGLPAAKFLRDLADDWLSFEKNSCSLEERRLRTLTFLACRSSVMAGEALSRETMEGLVERFRQGGFTPTCPHGRPVFCTFPLSDLYRRFGRR